MQETYESFSFFKIYCDLDDVLTDFQQNASDAIGLSIRNVSSTLLWDCLKKKYSFFETIPWKKGKHFN